MSSDPPSGAPGRGGDVDQRTWNKGVIVATLLAAFVVVVGVVWLATNTPHTANNVPPPATGQGSSRPPAAK